RPTSCAGVGRSGLGLESPRPNRYRAEDDIPSEPVVGRFAGLAVNEAAEPSAGQTSDVRAEVDDHRKDGAYLDDRGECGDAGIIDLSAPEVPSQWSDRRHLAP